MKATIAALFLVASSQVASAQDWADVARYREANRALSQRDPRRVVFLGDSITEGWAAQPFIHDNPHFVDRAISGQTAPQMLVRFQSDVVLLKPAVVHILAGTNDFAQNTGPETEDEIFGYIISMAELARANRIKIVIASVLPAADFPWHRGLDPAPAIKALNARLKVYAASHNLIYADYWSVLATAGGAMKPQYSKDGVHPNASAYDAMRPVARAAIERAMHER
ncbi:MAG TPA: GDSL-type esterase/lipase family protein [Sphingomicrobium sp.]|nr:GDSL-type esterase/lipase family protein [Sphingomicrobium sp.]